MSIVWTRLLRFAQFGFQFATAMKTAAPAIDTLLFVQCCSQKRDLFVVHVANLFWRQLSILTVLNDYFVASLLCANHQSKEANIHFRHWHSLCPNSVEIAVCIVITSFGNQIWIWLIDVSHSTKMNQTPQSNGAGVKDYGRTKTWSRVADDVEGSSILMETIEFRFQLRNRKCIDSVARGQSWSWSNHHNQRKQ